MCFNSLLLCLAPLRAGLVVVNFNPLYTAREFAFQLKDAGVTGLIVLESFAHTLSRALEKCEVKHVIVTKMGDCLKWKKPIIDFVIKYVKKMVPPWEIKGSISFKEAVRKGAQLPFEEVPMKKDDVAFLQYTGGTTGVPKGAMLTHQNILANIAQALVWVKSILSVEEETSVGALPFYHIFSLTVCCFCFMALGATCFLITNPRDIKGFIKSLGESQITVFVGINTLFSGLLNHPNFADANFSKLKLSIGGGMATQKSVSDEWFEKTGTIIIEGYGLTEASPVVSINPLDLKTFSGSIGLPLPNTEVIIRDEEGYDLPLNEPGELCVRGPQVMKGYWKKPEETEKVIDDNGWLHTGDIARIDERGFIYLLDRKKDMIIVSGFNVYPNEIEDILTSHPGIREAAVIGLSSEKTGEQIKAFIVRKDKNLTKDEVIKHCREFLTAYKVPKIIEFREELPKTNVGKVLRRALRDEN
ncbi:AMP-binding protein [Coxiella burnetii]|uniref:AMP-binding protein n=2 Tax=Coxiella burnetii TaxID=777 RepID=UPI001E5DF3EA|nr:AMP-binding protein [Coxiella burnetii]